MRTRYGILPLLLLSAACERGSSDVPEEVLAARFDAKRRACIGTELVRQSEDEIRTLEETLATPVSGPAAAITRSAATAALEFARAYQQHAQLRLTVLAQADSAANHSPSPDDSARHAAHSERFEISRPEPGTVEANVIADYEQKFGALLADADHPCNWDLEEEEGGKS